MEKAIIQLMSAQILAISAAYSSRNREQASYFIVPPSLIYLRATYLANLQQK